MAEDRKSDEGLLSGPEAETKLEPLPEFSKNGRLIGPKYEAYQILRAAGMPQTRAAAALGMCRASGTKMERAVSKRYDLTSKKYLKLASKAIQNILKGQPWGEIKQIKDSTALAAASEIYGRAQPPPKKENNTEQITFIKIDLNSCK